MIRHNPHLNRRNVLQSTAGAALVGIAGCLNDDSRSSNGTDQSKDQSAFQQVAVEGTALIVKFSSDTGIDQVNLIRPNGELFGQREVAAGSQQVSFEIGTSYTSGEYDVVALKDDETTAETSFAIEPNLAIVEMGIGRNNPRKMWDGTEDEIDEEAFVTVENRGNGPDSITKLLFIGDVPYPSDEGGTNYADDEDVSGIFDPDTDSEVDDVIIAAGEQLTIYSSRSPFAFVPSAGTSCTDEEQTGEFDLILETRVDGDRVSKTYDIQYSASGEQDNCEITISE